MIFPSRRSLPIFAFLMAAAPFVVSVAAAQQPKRPAERAATVVKHVRALRVPNGAITVDGDMQEPDWQRAEAATDFVQQQPREGAPATHRSDYALSIELPVLA